jgi:hypothetical protein
MHGLKRRSFKLVVAVLSGVVSLMLATGALALPPACPSEYVGTCPASWCDTICESPDWDCDCEEQEELCNIYWCPPTSSCAPIDPNKKVCAKRQRKWHTCEYWVAGQPKPSNPFKFDCYGSLHTGDTPTGACCSS